MSKFLVITRTTKSGIQSETYPSIVISIPNDLKDEISILKWEKDKIEEHRKVLNQFPEFRKAELNGYMMDVVE